MSKQSIGQIKVKKHMSSKRKSAILLSVALILTIFALLLGTGVFASYGNGSVYGLSLSGDGVTKLLPWIPTTNTDLWPQSISLGLDLRGGVFVEYEAPRPEDMHPNTYAVQLDNTMQIMLSRLTEKGYTEATASIINNTGIRIEIPDVSDPAAVLEMIGTPAKLTFEDQHGNVLDGEHVTNTGVAMDPSGSGYYVVEFQLDAEGTTLFSTMTSQNLGGTIDIKIDGTAVMSPTVNTVISGGSGYIEGRYDLEGAQNLAIQIQSGALPLDLEQTKMDTISATLGIDALKTSVIAAIIGIAAIMLFMLYRYRLCGLVADYALVVYIIVLFLLLAILPGIQLTLPGIAGIVLGLGMAVDANVVIFERIGEEIQNGRPIRLAVSAGFKNAWSAVIDANVTTIIAALVLIVFGTGSIQGFAYTLLISVVVSLLSAVFVTRSVLRNAINIFGDTIALYSRKKLSSAKEAQ